MKTSLNMKTIFMSALIAFVILSCTDKEKEAEAREEEKVGNIYNEEQGVDVENRDNQFPASRNDNEEGTGQETGAPSDTIDGDGDKKVNAQ
jgi:hypothetical protein